RPAAARAVLEGDLYRVRRTAPNARAPTVPDPPAAPDKPAAPNEPTAPDEPVAPNEPVASDEPVAPNEPVASNEPVAPDEPVAPHPPVAADEPVAAAVRPVPSDDTVARRWLVAGTVAWLAIACGLFSAVRDLQPRYLEALSPALAIAVGVGGGALMRRARRRPTALLLALALAGNAYFAETIGGIPDAALTTCLAAGGAALFLLLVGATLRLGRLRGVWAALVSMACAATLLAAPVGVSIEEVDGNLTVAGVMGSGSEFADYLHAHRHGAYYEVASTSVYGVVTLIAHDAQPVLVLSDFHGPLVSLPKLMSLVRLRAVRHIIISHACRSGPHCPTTTVWSLKHSREVVRGGLYEYILPLTPDTKPVAPRRAVARRAPRRTAGATVIARR
ncbi:MAG: hypothetical protein ACR2KV_15745, partial [Solirubrobacteraceae bacterium]